MSSTPSFQLPHNLPQGVVEATPINENFEALAEYVNGGSTSPLSYPKVTPQMFGAKGDGVTDDTIAIRRALETGENVRIPPGLYVITGELEMKFENQRLEFDNHMALKYGNSSIVRYNNSARKNGSGLLLRGTFDKEIRTRRKHRGSANAPQDAPLSCAINIQAEGCTVVNPSMMLWCDFSNPSPTNYGDNCDVGIFIANAVQTYIDRPLIIGYFRNASIYVDNTGLPGNPRFNDIYGVPYPNTTVNHGSDGLTLNHPLTMGGRAGLRVLGPENPVTEMQYWDIITGLPVDDKRGGFGCSDLYVLRGSFYSVEHHSKRRALDATPDGNGLLSYDTLISEPWDAPCTLQIDGFRDPNRPFQGMRFTECRFASSELFNVRLGGVNRADFDGCHTEGRQGFFMADGTPITDANYKSVSYGMYAGTEFSLDLNIHRSSFRSTESIKHLYSKEFTWTTEDGSVYLSNGRGIYYRGTDGLYSRVESAAADGIVKKSRPVLEFSSGAVYSKQQCDTFTQKGTRYVDFEISVSALNNTTDTSQVTLGDLPFTLSSGTVIATNINVAASTLLTGTSALTFKPYFTGGDRIQLYDNNIPVLYNGGTVNASGTITGTLGIPLSAVVKTPFTPTLDFVDGVTYPNGEQTGVWYDLVGIRYIELYLNIANLNTADSSGFTVNIPGLPSSIPISTVFTSSLVSAENTIFTGTTALSVTPYTSSPAGRITISDAGNLLRYNSGKVNASGILKLTCNYQI